MVQACGKCARANPAEASYCYHDGFVLAGHVRNGGPLVSGSQSFPHTFIFPSGAACRNFDQFALTCHEKWPEALGLLQEGYLETFLGGLGRADLALAAREAAKYPDRARGLDQLLGKLPSHVLEAGKLLVEPSEVNLGQIDAGHDRTFELHLQNQGMRLLFGSVTCENCAWLSLGEAPGTPQKHFEFTADQVILVQVRGKQLRAGNKPLEGKLTVESNGGNFSVVVRAEVPVKPFVDGVLAGARTPRQVAEKAKAHPRDAAPLFEKGAVHEWYDRNGWTYPVEGPPASGLGAVQQFFEALGLTPPPKVQLEPGSVSLTGNAGDRLEFTLKVRTHEKRPVYAHGVSDQPWLHVGRAVLDGNSATVPVVIPSIPAAEGQTIQAKLTIQANGNQRFVVPVALEVAFNFNFAGGGSAVELPFSPAEDSFPSSAAEKVQNPFETPPDKPPAVVEDDLPSHDADLFAPPGELPGTHAQPSSKKIPKAKPHSGKAVPPGDRIGVVHFVPAILLGVTLLGVIGYDVVSTPGLVSIVPLDQRGERAEDAEKLDPTPRIDVQFDRENYRFGIVTKPPPREADKAKPLTRDPKGKTNNTCIRVGDQEVLFGDPPGAFVKKGMTTDSKAHRTTATWALDDLTVVQTVEIVHGEQSRQLDTCLVRYTIENRSTNDKKVGLRVMLDTLIGTNDGAPFQLPGENALIEQQGDYSSKKVPDFVRAQENNDPKNPGMVATIGLRVADTDPVSRLLLCRWPDPFVKWKWDPEDINKKGEPPDSCVAIYWDPVDIPPQGKRVVAFTYGLDRVSSTTGTIGIAFHGSTKPDGIFTVTAVVKNPDRSQKVRVQLPAGLTLEDKGTEEKSLDKIEQGKDGQVSWRVRAGGVGVFPVKVISAGASAEDKVRINKGSIFN